MTREVRHWTDWELNWNPRSGPDHHDDELSSLATESERGLDNIITLVFNQIKMTVWIYQQTIDIHFYFK